MRAPLAGLDSLVQHLDVPAERHGGARHATLLLAGAPIEHGGDEQLPVANAQEDLLELAGAEEPAALPPKLDLAGPPTRDLPHRALRNAPQRTKKRPHAALGRTAKRRKKKAFWHCLVYQE